jgi:hypothetical protein
MPRAGWCTVTMGAHHKKEKTAEGGGRLFRKGGAVSGIMIRNEYEENVKRLQEDR